MSEPTIRLPLHQGYPNNYDIYDASSRRIDMDKEAAALVSLVNSQAERIRGLEEAIRLALDVYHPRDAKEVLRAALDKAGKEDK